jgi:hypothetical protein
MPTERRRATFRRVARSHAAADNPRELFRDLPRDTDVRFLWGHQDRILERYEAHAGSKDIALELPTGTGKTLIGLLIAEWRRSARGERALYLCPTRQLAHQVGTLADRYGIDAKVCLPPGYDGLARWHNGDATAISTYSALFNYNPRFTAQAVILDDAHAAENYVADHWTVTIDRQDMADEYGEVARLLGPAVDHRTAALMLGGEPGGMDRSAVELVPLPRWWPLSDGLRELLDECVEDTDEWYAWTDYVRDGLAACCVLVSAQEIVIRPLVPTTRNHVEFAGATQRLYMSATLGDGGELERIFGVRAITRLPVPDEWERRSTGRRLFLLPAASLRPNELDSLVVDAVQGAGRALVLTPTRDRVKARVSQLAQAGIATVVAGDIEETLDPFVSRPSAALVLANRYDGIDLPGVDCRLLVLAGLPVAVNALERFLYQRLAATGLPGERMRTRLTQGVGRCSRAEDDWCAVLVASREGYDFCARGEIRQLLHAELQGELGFGLDQSHDRKASDFLDMLGVLLDHDEEWQDAEAEIRQLRDAATKGIDPAAQQLERAVAHEVDFTYAMWDGDFPRTVERAVAAADELGGQDAAAYRAWWLYQAGAAAWLAHHTFRMAGMLSRHARCFGARRRPGAPSGGSPSWRTASSARTPNSTRQLTTCARLSGPKARCGRSASTGKALGEGSASCAAGWPALPPHRGRKGSLSSACCWASTRATPRARALAGLCVIASERLAFVWEAKTEEATDGEVGARTAQQANGHIAWLREHHDLADGATIVSLLVSDRQRLAAGVEVHAGELRIVNLDDVRSVAGDAMTALRRARSRGQEGDDVGLRATLVEELARLDLLPTQLAARLGAWRLTDLT